MSIDDATGEEWNAASAAVRREGAQHVCTPPSRVVGVCEFQGQIIVACETGVFRLDDGKLVPIPFAQAIGSGY